MTSLSSGISNYRSILTASGLVAMTGFLAFQLGCESLSGQTESYTGNASAGATGVGIDVTELVEGAGVGADCTQFDCRIGLTCGADGLCEPARNKTEGTFCLIGPECADGLHCVLSEETLGGYACTPAGEGEVGDACQSDLDCAGGLRCDIIGLGTECAEAGTQDVNEDCDANADCYQGLYCINGECTVPSNADIFFGVDCDAPSEGAVSSLFEVPGASGTVQTDFFALPYPNNVRLDETVDLSGFPTPGKGIVGIDIVDVYKQKINGTATGFSANPSVIFRFDGTLDFNSLGFENGKRPVAMADLDGSRDVTQGVTWSAGEGQTNYVCDNWLAVRAALGESLHPGHTYAFWVTNDARAADGSAITRSPQLDAMLSSTRPSDSVLAAEWSKYQSFRDYLAEPETISASDIVHATVFTVDDVLATMRAAAADVASEPTPTTSGWVKCGGGATSPCQGEGSRTCGESTSDYDEYHALVRLPIYQQGEAPYLTTGGNIGAKSREEDVCMSVTVPKSAAPDSGYPLILFGHGTGGSFRSHVRDSVAGVLARSETPFAVLAIDQVQHGPRRGDGEGSDESPDNLFFNFLNPDAGQGNPIQGALDQLSLMKLSQSLSIEAGVTGGDAIAFDANRVFLFGHSQGSTHGSLSLVYSELEGAVFSGNGGSFVHALLNKTEPVDIASAIPYAVQDVGSDGEFRMGEMHPVLALLQHYIDPADPVNFAPLLTSRPADGISAKHVFQTFGFDDSYSPPSTLSAYARGARDMALAPHPDGVTPTGDNDTQLTVYNQPVVQGNVAISDSETRTSVVRQYQGPADSDGHFVVYDVQEANDDVVGFLTDLAKGEVPSVPAN